MRQGIEISMINVTKNSRKAIVPKRSERYFTGLEFFSAYEYKIEPHGNQIINTEIILDIPKVVYGTLIGDIDFMIQNNVTIANDMADLHYDDYHNTIKFALFNNANKEIVVKHGQKIGHLIVKESLVLPMIGNVYPDSDDDAVTECGCNGLSNRFEKFKLDKE
jgi:dUTP pyrophosphatase